LINSTKLKRILNGTSTLLAAGFLAGGSRQEKASVRLPCSGKKLAANVSGVYDETGLHKTII